MACGGSSKVIVGWNVGGGRRALEGDFAGYIPELGPPLRSCYGEKASGVQGQDRGYYKTKFHYRIP